MIKVAYSSNMELPVSDEYIENIGNLDNLKDQYGKTYTFIRRSVKPIGILFFESMAIKLYHMIRKTEPLPKHLVATLDAFIEKEMKGGNIEVKQGVGYGILSQGFLSINIWGRGNVMFSQTYTVEKNDLELSREPLEKTGVACTWESKIMNFEYNLWHTYLMTSMNVKDKKDYLMNFISGDL